MNKEKIVKAFDDFVEERYGDSEDTLRREIQQAVSDHLKDKLQLKNDLVKKEVEETEE